MTAEEYFGGWYKLFEKDTLEYLAKRTWELYSKAKVYPDYKSIFRAFNLCPYESLKVVMLGQDPYSDGSATGLAFANEGKKKLSPSLEVIRKALLSYNKSSIKSFDPTLVSWAKQGVLLLNSSLTVEDGKPMSHTLVWRPFIGQLLKRLSNTNPGIIYVLFGEQAQSFRSYINENDAVLEIPHPAYFARKKEDMPDIFSIIDTFTLQKNNLRIKWYEQKD